MRHIGKFSVAVPALQEKKEGDNVPAHRLFHKLRVQLLMLDAAAFVERVLYLGGFIPDSRECFCVHAARASDVLFGVPARREIADLFKTALWQDFFLCRHFLASPRRWARRERGVDSAPKAEFVYRS